MIVFRDHHRVGITKDYINRIYSGLKKTDLKKPNYQDSIDLLINAGELETGISDYNISGSGEIVTPQIKLCRSLTINTGKIVCKLWHDKSISNETWIIRNILKKLKSTEIPDIIRINVPEGFVYYGLYPETYIDAANKFFEKYVPKKTICIGIRSIGTQLSALVSAQLQLKGCDVVSFTVRLKGHPFSRYLVLSNELQKIIEKCKQYWFIIVDEGPGLSGSTIGGTINKLVQSGVNPKKIVIFPSWESDGKKFVSKTARELWPQFEKFIGQFQYLWVKSGKLESGFKCDIIHEFSAGMWRKYLIKSIEEYPAIHPHHEKRKYLLKIKGSKKNKLLFAKFVGFGNYGKEIINRGRVLGKNGFSPEIKKYVNGFAIMPFIYGQPMKSSEADQEFIKFVVRYFAFINNSFPASLSASWEKMAAMITHNTTEGLGYEWGRRAQNLVKKISPLMYEYKIVAIDGHVMPHEWIKTDSGFKKVDFLEHWTDQFFVGPQNIAWDIAGMIIEFGFNEKMKNMFLDYYKKKSNDKKIEVRLPFYLVAYCAFRLGYLSLAQLSVPDLDEKERFTVLKSKFRDLLKVQLLKNTDWK